MPLIITCYLKSVLPGGRAGLFALASFQAIGLILCANCSAQDFFGQSAASPQSEEPATIMTLMAQPALLDDLQLNQGQRDQIAKILTDLQTAKEQLQASHDEQLKSVTSIRDRLRKRAELRAEMRTEIDPKQKDVERALRELLNANQIGLLEEKLASNGGGNSSDPTTSERRDQQPKQSASPRPQTPVVRSPDAKASFALEGQENGEKTQANATVGENAVTRVAFNFHQAPWTDVLRLFADSANLNLNLRDTPPGTFTYYDRQQYSPREALDIMNRFLLQDGFLMVPHDRFLTVLDAKKGIPPNLVETVSPEELSARGDTEYLRAAFGLGDREATAAAEEIRGLLGPQGTVVPLTSANSIVVSDITENLARVKLLLEPPPKVEDTDRTFRSFPLLHIDAPSAAEIVRSLFGLQVGLNNVSEAGSRNSSRNSGGSRDSRRDAVREFFSGRGGPGGGRGGRDESSRGGDSRSAATQPAVSAAKVAVDLRTNSLLVTASAAEMKLIEDIVKSLDVPPNQQQGFGGVANNEPYLQVYELNSADASEVAKTLTVLHPGMVINEDGRAKRIHIWADAQSHREISSHIRQLDGAIAGEVIAIVGLNGQNAYDVSTRLTALYKEDEAGAPAIELDPSGQGLMIRGNASQIAQIRSLVDQLGTADALDSQQTVRLVPVSTSSSDYLQQAIGALYPQVTVTTSEQTESSNESSSRGRDRGRGNSDENSERAERIRRFMEMRSRFGGFGDGGRGSGRGGEGRGRGDRGGDRGDRSSRGGR